MYLFKLLIFVIGIVSCEEIWRSAAFVLIIRYSKSDFEQATQLFRSIESSFNHWAKYDYIVFHDGIRERDKAFLKSQVSTTIHYELTDFLKLPEHYDSIDIADEIKEYPGNIYSLFKQQGRESYPGYRRICRAYSGPIFNHPLISKYKYIWKLDSNSFYFCNITFNPFQFMYENGKKYAWISLQYEETRLASDTLWPETIRFVSNSHEKEKYLKKLQLVKTGWPFGDGYYDRCFFGGSFEILDVDTFRSKPFMDYFEWLDKAFGFMTYRWSDGLVRTLAVQMFLEKEELWKMDNIGYKHFGVCSMEGKCTDTDGIKESCRSHFKRVYSNSEPEIEVNKLIVLFVFVFLVFYFCRARTKSNINRK